VPKDPRILASIVGIAPYPLSPEVIAEQEATARQLKGLPRRALTVETEPAPIERPEPRVEKAESPRQSPQVELARRYLESHPSPGRTATQIRDRMGPWVAGENKATGDKHQVPSVSSIQRARRPH
jgi:hypothetical protein